MRERILAKIKPTAEEEKKDLDLAKRVISILGDLGLEAVLVGSVAKGTSLRGKKDIDIFILFPRDTPMDELENMGKKAGRIVSSKLGGKLEIHYAQHPYSRIHLGDRIIEIVPAYKVKKGETLSAVDRTPLHTEYVKSKLDKRQRDDVRLLKWFMKQIGVYGAEIMVHGFSGYLCELLIINYGSFERVLEEASVWDPPIFIDLEGYYSREEALEMFNHPLVVIDPVDKRRNVASPVSLESLARFVLASRKFIETGKLPKKARISLTGRDTISVVWRIREENEEIVWSQLESFSKRIAKTLESHGFRVVDVSWWTDSKSKAEAIFDLEVSRLPRILERIGPRVFDFENSQRFIEKYKKVYVKEDRLVGERKREFWRAEDLIKKVLEQSPRHLGKDWRITRGKTKILNIYSKKMWKW